VHELVTDIIDVGAEFTIARQALWDLLLEPQTYPRLFAGIGGCERVESRTDDGILEVRVGTPESGIRTHQVRFRVCRWYESFELECLGTGSFASVRLRGDEKRTKIVITLFAPARMHPSLPEQSNDAVMAWVNSGLQHAVDVISGAHTSVVVNAENSPLRRQVGVAKQIMSTRVARPTNPATSIKQVRSLAKWGSRAGMRRALRIRRIGSLSSTTSVPAPSLSCMSARTRWPGRWPPSVSPPVTRSGCCRATMRAWSKP
jgi:hypothetical protein